MQDKKPEKVGIYIPPHLRNKGISSRSNEEEKTLSNRNSNKPSGSWEENREFETVESRLGDPSVKPIPFQDPASKHSSIKSCIVLSGFSVDMDLDAKGRVVDSYLKLGGRSKWIGENRVIIAFSSEAVASRALKFNRNPFIVAQNLDEAVDCEEFISDAVVLQCSVVPERTATVANRMIGAHLGLKIPRKVNPPEAKVVDAWDD